MHVLLAHADVELGDAAMAVLGRRSISVSIARCVAEAIRRLESATFDAVAADAGLDEGGGGALLGWLRSTADTPVIVLADQHDEAEMERMFVAGADDYLSQPYSAKELLLRLEAVARRRRPVSSAEVIELDGLLIDRDTWQVSYDGQSVRLTRTEQRILYCLAAHAGRVTPTERLVRFAWRDRGGDTNVLKTHLSHVRRKLSAVGAPFLIRAVPATGYVLEPGPLQAVRNGDGGRRLAAVS